MSVIINNCNKIRSYLIRRTVETISYDGFEKTVFIDYFRGWKYGRHPTFPFPIFGNDYIEFLNGDAKSFLVDTTFKEYEVAIATIKGLYGQKVLFENRCYKDMVYVDGDFPAILFRNVGDYEETNGIFEVIKSTHKANQI